MIEVDVDLGLLAELEIQWGAEKFSQQLNIWRLPFHYCRYRQTSHLKSNSLAFHPSKGVMGFRDRRTQFKGGEMSGSFGNDHPTSTGSNEMEILKPSILSMSIVSTFTSKLILLFPDFFNSLTSEEVGFLRDYEEKILVGSSFWGGSHKVNFPSSLKGL